MQLLYPEMFEQTTGLDARGNKVPGPVKLIEEDPTIVIQKWLNKGNVGASRWLNEGKQTSQPTNIMTEGPGIPSIYDNVEQPQQNRLTLTPDDATYLNERLNYYKSNPNSNAIPEMFEYLKGKGISIDQAKEIVRQALTQ